MMYSSTVDTPIGPFTAVVDADGAVIASGWTVSREELGLSAAPRKDLGEVTAAIRAYHEGDLTAPDGVPVRQRTSGAFLPVAWEALRNVKPGATITYAELARLAGRPRAIRAAAQACARNGAALFVPCHRVIGADGSLTGFRWGIDIKRWLIDHER